MSGHPVADESAERFVDLLDGEATAQGGGQGAETAWPGLPDWVWQVAGALFDGQDDTTSKDWALRLHRALARLDGRIPFVVVHDWHGRVVAPMLAEARMYEGGSAERQQALGNVHMRVLAGEYVEESEWSAALEPALAELYRDAYGYAAAFDTAYANARAYAEANGFGDDEADKYGRTYAELSTGANARSFADANAMANARAAAVAYTTADERTYAEAYPSAYVHAYAHACSTGSKGAEQGERRGAAYRRLADGLIDCLARAAS